MKTLLVLLLAITICQTSFSQELCYPAASHILKGNRIAAKIYNDGTLFHDYGKGFFKFPYYGDESPTTIRKVGLWMGGFDPGGNLKIAATSPTIDANQTDYTPGPLHPETGQPYEDFPCEYFNRVWSVTREEVVAHIFDWTDNKQIDTIRPNILLWPGNGNPHFYPKPLPTTSQGWAPFFDVDSDGVYDPLKGDFPVHDNNQYIFSIPKEMTWSVFHDERDHPVTNGLPIRMEIQQTAWTRDCPMQPEIENTVFVEYKLINRAQEDIDSLFVGIWTDFENGCGEDDYFGSMPHRDAFYSYNADSMDGDSLGVCESGNTGYGVHSPIMSVKFLYNGIDHELKNFTYYYGEDSPAIGMTPPNLDIEFYRYITGSWRDGSWMTDGGNGYNPASIEFTKHAFPGMPHRQDRWSMLSEGFDFNKKYCIGSNGLVNLWGVAALQPGQAGRIVVAFTCHPNPHSDQFNLLDNLESSYLLNLDERYAYWFGGVGDYCSDESIWLKFPEEEEEPIIPGIYPNPTTGQLTIALPESTIKEVIVYNTAWQMVMTDKIEAEEKKTLDLTGLGQGLYFLKINFDGNILVRKVFVH